MGLGVCNYLNRDFFRNKTLSITTCLVTLVIEKGGVNNQAGMKRARSNPLCRCAKQAVKRTSRKDNANKGKEYWACSSRMEEGCQFFKWVEDEPTNWLTAASKKKTKTENAGCHCKQSPVRRQSTKEGVNEGRWYLSCTPCNFFQWDSPVVEQPAAETETKKEKDEKEEPEREASPETGFSIDSPGYDFFKAHPTIQYTRLMCAAAGGCANLVSVPFEQRRFNVFKEAAEEKVEKDEGKYAMTITVPDDWDWNAPYVPMYDPDS